MSASGSEVPGWKGSSTPSGQITLPTFDAANGADLLATHGHTDNAAAAAAADDNTGTDAGSGSAVLTAEFIDTATGSGSGIDDVAAHVAPGKLAASPPPTPPSLPKSHASPPFSSEPRKRPGGPLDLSGFARVPKRANSAHT